MNWLTICQTVVREAGLGLSGPTTVVSQTGELLNVITWAEQAWANIQSEWNWDWLWESTTVTVASGSSSVAGTIPDTRYVKDATYRGNVEMSYLPYDVFRRAWPPGTIVAGTPSVWTIAPDKSFRVNSLVTDDTAFTVERYKNPVSPTGNTYEPALPAEYHMMIVWRAVMLYAGHDEAGPLYQHAAEEYRKLHAAATRTEKPAVRFWGGW